jgi:hypothetical protein
MGRMANLCPPSGLFPLTSGGDAQLSHAVFGPGRQRQTFLFQPALQRVIALGKREIDAGAAGAV